MNISSQKDVFRLRLQYFGKRRIKHGIPFQREFELEGANIDLRNDFCLYKITNSAKTLELFFKSNKTNIGDVKMTFWDCELLHLCAYCEDLGKCQAHFIDLVRTNWDNMTGYIEKDNEMLLSLYFDEDLESITLYCKSFEIVFV